MLKYENDRDKYTSSMQGLSTAVTLILFVLYLVLHTFIDTATGLSTIVMVLMFSQMLFSPSFQFWSSRQRFEYKYKALVGITIFQALLTPAISLLLIFNIERKDNAIIIGYVAGQVLISVFFYVRNFFKGKKFYIKEYWSFALKFNLPLIPHYLSGIVLGQADRIMIDRMIGKSQAGIYGLSYQLSLVLNIVTSGINSSFVPWTYQQLKEKQYRSIGKVSNFLLILLFIISIMIVLVAPEILLIMAPPEYSEARWIIPPVVLSVFFTFLYTLFANIEFYYEQTKFVMIASVIGAVLNIGLNFWLLPTLGYISAGYTTLICYIVFSLAHFVFMKKVLKKFAGGVKVYNTKFILFLSTTLILISFGLMSIYDFWYIRYGLLVILIAVMVSKRKVLINGFKQIRSK